LSCPVQKTDWEGDLKQSNFDRIEVHIQTTCHHKKEKRQISVEDEPAALLSRVSQSKGIKERVKVRKRVEEIK